MADRIDVLGANPEHVNSLGGGTLCRDLDAELQECVALAAEQMGAPIALVSLVLARTQFFRAHVGLPAELAVAQATDRDASFCQFVVRDGAPFEVNDAKTDARVPQELVKLFGIRAYFGVPVFAHDTVVGSLCVIDTVSRAFSDEEKSLLVVLAERASQRLQELTLERPSARLIENGTGPAFAEIRNLLVPITIGFEIAQHQIDELVPIAALLESDLASDEKARALISLSGSAKTIRGLEQIHASLVSSLARITPVVLAVEAAVSRPSIVTPIDKIVSAGLELAHHTTKLIGGVQAADVPDAFVRCPLSVGALVISTACSQLASRLSGQAPLSARVELEDDVVAVYLTSALPEDDIAEVVTALETLSREGTSAVVSAHGNSLRVEFPAGHSRRVGF